MHNPYYNVLNWTDLGGFDISKWKLIKIATPMDGSCLFHAIANSHFTPYHNESYNGKYLSRRDIVKLLRRDMSVKLSERIPGENSKTYYDTLNNGNTSEFSEFVPEFRLSYMQSQLDSDNPIGYGYMEFIGNILEKDIYILDGCRHDIYVTDELPLTIKGNRNSIVLFYANGHYELVGLLNNSGRVVTYFHPQHSFITFLFKRCEQILKNVSI